MKDRSIDKEAHIKGKLTIPIISPNPSLQAIEIINPRKPTTNKPNPKDSPRIHDKAFSIISIY